jgi:L-malate glycosyltransferase
MFIVFKLLMLVDLLFKILFISHYTKLYGANLSLLGLIDQFLKSGRAEILVLLPSDGDFTEELKKRKIRYFIFPFTYCTNLYPEVYGGRLQIIRNYLEQQKRISNRKKINEAFLNKTLPLIDAEKIDLIYSNSSVIDVGYRLSKKLKVPHIFHVREFAKEHYNFVPDISVRKYYKMFKNSDLVICISDTLKKYLEKRVSNLKLLVIYNGIYTKNEASEIEILKKSYSSKSDFVFALIGVLSGKKGHETAIRSLSKLVKEGFNCKLIIAGSGNEKPLKILLKELDIEQKVEFRGYVKNTSEIYNEADGILMCSEYEALGRVTIEAMFHAKPVIGLNSGATPELIINNYNGLIAEVNAEDLSEKMKQLILNPDSGRAMGERGREKALANFLLEDRAEETFNEIIKLLPVK